MSNVYLSENDLQGFITQMETLDTKLFSTLSSFSKLLKSLAEEGFVSGKVHSRLAQIQFYAEDTFTRFSGSCFKSAKPILETYVASIEKSDTIMIGPRIGISQVHDYSESTVSSNSSIFSECNGLASELQNVAVTYDCSSDKVQEYITFVNQEAAGYVQDIGNLMNKYSGKYQSISEEVAIADSDTAKGLTQVISNLNFVYSILSRLFSLIATPSILLSSDGRFNEQLSAIVYDRYFEKDGTLKKRAIQNLTDIFTKDMSELSPTDVQYVNDILKLINSQKDSNLEAYKQNLGAFISSGYINNYREPKILNTYNGVEITAYKKPTVITMEDIGRVALNCECKLSNSFIGIVSTIQSENSDSKDYLDTYTILDSVMKYKDTINITKTLSLEDVYYTGTQIPKEGPPVIPSNVMITGVQEYTAVYAVKDNVLKNFYGSSKATVKIESVDLLSEESPYYEDGKNGIFRITSNEATNADFTSRITIDTSNSGIIEQATNPYHDYTIDVFSTSMSDAGVADVQGLYAKAEDYINKQSVKFNLGKELTKEVIGKVPGGSTLISVLEEDYATVGAKAIKKGVGAINVPSTSESATVGKVSVDKKNNVVKVSTTSKIPFVGEVVSSAANIYKSYAKSVSANNQVTIDQGDLDSLRTQLVEMNYSPNYSTVRTIVDNNVQHGNGTGTLVSVDICTFDSILK